MNTWSRGLNADFTLDDYLFGLVKFTKNVDPDKYGYSGYGIRFDVRSQFSLAIGEWDKNVVIFGMKNSSSNHVHNRKIDTLNIMLDIY